MLRTRSPALQTLGGRNFSDPHVSLAGIAYATTGAANTEMTSVGDGLHPRGRGDVPPPLTPRSRREEDDESYQAVKSAYQMHNARRSAR